jgi:2-C-methyl-D-erythritol 4-phosphate cytidylyltransferase
VERMGYRVQLVECSKQNMKITTPEDIAIATAILKMRKQREETQS